MAWICRASAWMRGGGSPRTRPTEAAGLQGREGRFALWPTGPDQLLFLRTPVDGRPGAPGRVVLSGDLSGFPLADLLAFLAQSRWSGTVRVMTPAAVRGVLLHEGDVRGAMSDDPRDALAGGHRPPGLRGRGAHGAGPGRGAGRARGPPAGGAGGPQAPRSVHLRHPAGGRDLRRHHALPRGHLRAAGHRGAGEGRTRGPALHAEPADGRDPQDRRAQPLPPADSARSRVREPGPAARPPRPSRWRPACSPPPTGRGPCWSWRASCA